MVRASRALTKSEKENLSTLQIARIAYMSNEFVSTPKWLETLTTPMR